MERGTDPRRVVGVFILGCKGFHRFLHLLLNETYGKSTTLRAHLVDVRGSCKGVDLRVTEAEKEREGELKTIVFDTRDCRGTCAAHPMTPPFVKRDLL
jgi:hypothetical protein